MFSPEFSFKPKILQICGEILRKIHRKLWPFIFQSPKIDHDSLLPREEPQDQHKNNLEAKSLKGRDEEQQEDGLEDEKFGGVKMEELYK